jgi:hypothetical protein
MEYNIQEEMLFLQEGVAFIMKAPMNSSHTKFETVHTVFISHVVYGGEKN